MGFFSKKPPKPPHGTIHATRDKKNWGRLQDWSRRRIKAELSRIKGAKEFNATVGRRYNAARWELYNSYEGTRQMSSHPMGRAGKNPFTGDREESSMMSRNRTEGLRFRGGGKTGFFAPGTIPYTGFDAGTAMFGGSRAPSGYGVSSVSSRGAQGTGMFGGQNSLTGGQNITQPQGGYTDPLDRWREQHNADLASDRGDESKGFGGRGMFGGNQYGGGLPGRDPWNQQGQGTRAGAEVNQAMWDEFDESKTAYDEGVATLSAHGSRSGLPTTGEGDEYWTRRLNQMLSTKQAEVSAFNTMSNPAGRVDPRLIESRREQQTEARAKKVSRGGTPRRKGVLNVTDPSLSEGGVV